MDLIARLLAQPSVAMGNLLVVAGLLAVLALAVSGWPTDRR